MDIEVLEGIFDANDRDPCGTSPSMRLLYIYR